MLEWNIVKHNEGYIKSSKILKDSGWQFSWGIFPDKNEKMVHVSLDGFPLVSSHDELWNLETKIQNF